MTKTDFDISVSSLNSNITANKTKNESIENKLRKLKTFDLSYFGGKSHLKEDETQNYLAFQPMNRYFKVIGSTDYVSSWKSKGLSAETINPPSALDNSLTPPLTYYGTKTKVKFTGTSLKQPRVLYAHGAIVNIYIVY